MAADSDSLLNVQHPLFDMEPSFRSGYGIVLRIDFPGLDEEVYCLYAANLAYVDFFENFPAYAGISGLRALRDAQAMNQRVVNPRGNGQSNRAPGCSCPCRQSCY